jgi:hypothetical protein
VIAQLQDPAAMATLFCQLSNRETAALDFTANPTIEGMLPTITS